KSGGKYEVHCPPSLWGAARTSSTHSTARTAVHSHSSGPWHSRERAGHDPAANGISADGPTQFRRWTGHGEGHCQSEFRGDGTPIWTRLHDGRRKPTGTRPRRLLDG